MPYKKDFEAYRTLPDPPVESCAYVAGFFDGEGCIQIAKTSSMSVSNHVVGGLGLIVNVVNTNLEVIRSIQEKFGGTLIPKSDRRRTRPAYYLVFSGKNAAWFLHCLLPYLIVKRKQAEAALVFAETYFASWRNSASKGRPLTQEAVKLRLISFRAFRAAMQETTSRKMDWGTLLDQINQEAIVA